MSDPTHVEPKPDPGNSDPSQWTEDLTDDEEDTALMAMNAIAHEIGIPEGGQA